MTTCDKAEPETEIAAALLKDARYRAGLTQAQVAHNADISRPLVSEYERGKKDPSVTMLMRLIQACGMELRLEAAELSDTDRIQYERDARVGSAQAMRNAERLRSEVIPIRKISEQDAQYPA